MRKKLNVAFISNLYPPYVIGGAEILVSVLAERLALLKHKVTVISTKGKSNPLIVKSSANNVDVIRFFPKNLYWLYEKKSPNLAQKALWHFIDAWNYSTKKYFHEIIAGVKPDIIHTHNIDGFSPIIWNEAHKLGIPIVHTAHDYHCICPRSTLLHRDGRICNKPSFICKLYRRWYSLHASNVDCFSAPSRFVLDMYKNSGICIKKGVVINNAVPCESNYTNVCSNNSSTVHLLFLGQLNKHKGIITLLNAFNNLSLGPQCILHIAGKGPFEEVVVRNANMNPYIKYYGFISGEEKRKLIASADALIIPSEWYENAPISILEAYEYGIPVIGANIGGIPEFIQNSQNGLLFQAGNEEHLREQILQLMDGTLLEKLKRGAQLTRKEQKVEKMVTEYMEEYFKLLKR